MERTFTIFPKTISFIVLALNEEGKITKTVKTLCSSINSSDLDNYEIILVDDGSSDRTGELMDEMENQHPNIKVIHNPKNLGFGAAYLKGVENATMEYVMIIAGDNTMPESSIVTVVNSIGKTDMVMPFMTDARYRPFVRFIGSWVFARLINLLFKNRIKYYNSMVVRRDLFSSINVDATGYTLQAECVNKFIALGATYFEIGVEHGHRLNRESTSHALKIKNLKNVFTSLFALYGNFKKTNT